MEFASRLLPGLVIWDRAVIYWCEAHMRLTAQTCGSEGVSSAVQVHSARRMEMASGCRRTWSSLFRACKVVPLCNCVFYSVYKLTVRTRFCFLLHT